MSWLDTALDQTNQIVIRQGSRAFKPGEPAIDEFQTVWGVDTSQYSPEEYGDYYSKSNPVYSIVKMRSDYIAELPLRLYRTRVHPSLLGVPRGASPAEIRDIERINKALSNMGWGDKDPKDRKLDIHRAQSVLAQSYTATARVAATRMLALDEVTSGGVYDLLNHVNPYWSFNKLIRMMEISLCLWGETYLFVERENNSRTGKPIELWWTTPKRVRVIPDGKKYVSGYLYYPPGGGEPIPYAPWEVIRIHFPHPKDEFQPAPPLAAARLHADHEQSSMKGNLNFHKQGLHAGALISPTNRVRWTEEQAREIEEDINRRLRGTDKAHRWGAFRHEIKIYESGMSPKDSEFLEGMNYDIARICNAFGWPIDLIQAKNTYENINQSLQMAWMTTMSEASFIAAGLTEQLVPMFARPGVDILAFDSSHIAVLQESEAVRWEREKTMVDRVITRNEWRNGYGFPEHDGGDVLWVDERMIPISSPFAQAPSSAKVVEALQQMMAGDGKLMLEDTDMNRPVLSAGEDTPDNADDNADDSPDLAPEPVPV